MQIINKLSSRRFAGRIFSYFLVFSFLSLNVFSCAKEAVQKSLEADKIAFGKINRINVLCDQSVWDGPLGDSIRFYYSAAYPILPQPEPIFDLHHLTLEDMRKDPLRK